MYYYLGVLGTKIGYSGMTGVDLGNRNGIKLKFLEVTIFEIFAVCSKVELFEVRTPLFYVCLFERLVCQCLSLSLTLTMCNKV